MGLVGARWSAAPEDVESVGAVGSRWVFESVKVVTVLAVVGRCGDGEERREVSSSVDELEELSPTRAGGSLSGTASADVMWTGDSDNRSAASSCSVGETLLVDCVSSSGSANGFAAFTASGDESISCVSLVAAFLTFSRLD
jgi:hypothetical protein